MLLAIDVGNSRTKIAFGQEDAFEWADDVETDLLRAPGGFQSVLDGMLLAVPHRPRFAAIASVVPEVDSALRSTLRGHRIDTRFLSSESSAGLEILYETPHTLGADRIANAIYLNSCATLPSAMVDFGTATKIDVVDSKGVFVGGAILPGLKMMARALSSETAQLPPAELVAPRHAIGKSTMECLQSGTVLALAKAVEGLLDQMSGELSEGHELAVIGTGGLGGLMAPLCPRIARIEPHATLRGLLIAARRWPQASRAVPE